MIQSTPTTEDIFSDVSKKLIWWQHLLKLAKERVIFKIELKEHVITEMRNMHITFSPLKEGKDVVRYIEDLRGTKETVWCLND